MITVNDIAKLIGGKVLGDGDVPVRGLRPFFRNIDSKLEAGKPKKTG